MWPAKRSRVCLSSLAVAMVLAGCTTSGNSASDAADDSGSRPFDSGRPVKGTPLKIGFINQEGSPLGSFPEAREGAELAVEYINHHDGIDGRPVKLVKCTTSGSAESSQKCAQEMVDAKPVSVAFGFDLFSSAAFPVLRSADLTVVGGIPINITDLSEKDTYMFVGGSASAFPGLAEWTAKNLKPKHVAVFYLDAPTGKLAADRFIATPFDKLGVEYDLIPIAGGAPDVTPAVSRALSKDPDVAFYALAAADCGKVAAALRQLGFSGEQVFPGSCADKEVFAQVGTDMDGYYEAYNWLPDSNMIDLAPKSARDELRLYNGAAETYAPELHKSLVTQQIFMTFMTMWEEYKKIGADKLNPDSVAKAFEHGSGRVFQGPKWKCTSPAGYQAVCNPDIIVYQRKGNKPVKYVSKFFSGMDLLPSKPPSS